MGKSKVILQIHGFLDRKSKTQNTVDQNFIAISFFVQIFV